MTGARPRRGMALLAALVLLSLGAALVVGQSVAARTSAALARAAVARTVAERGPEEVALRLLADPALTAPLVAVGMQVTLRSRDSLLEDPRLLRRDRARVVRLAGERYLIVAERSVEDSLRPLARRRIALVVEPPTPLSSTAGDRLRPIPRWAFSDIY